MGRIILFLLLTSVTSLSASLLHELDANGFSPTQYPPEEEDPMPIDDFEESGNLEFVNGPLSLQDSSWTPQMARDGDDEEDPIPIDNIKASRRYGFKNTRRPTNSLESGRTSNFFHRLPSVEKSLLKDVIRIIMKNDDYMSFLNNPSFPELKKMIQKMMQDPSQRVIRRQLSNKAHSIEQLYNRWIKPLNELKIKGDAMKLLLDLFIASRANNLMAKDANELDDKIHLFAYLMQNARFRAMMKKLELGDRNVEVHRNNSHASRNFMDNRIFSKRNASSNVPPAQPSVVDYPPPYYYPGKPQLNDNMATEALIPLGHSHGTNPDEKQSSAINYPPPYDYPGKPEVLPSHFMGNRVVGIPGRTHTITNSVTGNTASVFSSRTTTTSSYHASGIPTVNSNTPSGHYSTPSLMTRKPMVVTTPKSVHGSTTQSWDHSTPFNSTRAPSQNHTTTQASAIHTTTVLPKSENSSSVPTTSRMTGKPDVPTTQRTIDKLIVDPGAQY